MQLIADSITKRFAGIVALDQVTVSVERGETVGVIGPNGSGKTTLMNVISGVIPPSGGCIRLGEERWETRPSHEVFQSGIARTFQTSRLFAEMTVLENVEVAATAGPTTKGWLRPRVVSRQVLAQLGLAPYEDVLASTLPHGVQRMVEIARAIVPRPRFVLLDEPGAGLNEAESDEMLTTLLDLRERIGVGLLLVDHDLRLIMRATDRICVLNEGSLLCTGTPREVRNNPDVIRAYIGSVARAYGAHGDEAQGVSGESQGERQR
jgi:ABC-type branched-subunit amino acid transport system ATPase component